jgi:hypothetical protein
MRSSEYIKLRDRKMVETFYQLYDVKRIRLDDVLQRMSVKMFFLDPDYIYKRIFYTSCNNEYYELLKAGKKPSAAQAQMLQLDLFSQEV